MLDSRTVMLDSRTLARFLVLALALCLTVLCLTACGLDSSGLGPPKWDHFYTTDEVEVASAGGAFYVYERIEGWVGRPEYARSGWVPLFRLYHGRNEDHFYTIDPEERDRAVSEHQYRYEGIAGYVIPTLTIGRHMFSGADEVLVPLHRLWHHEGFDHLYTTYDVEVQTAQDDDHYLYEQVACWVFRSKEAAQAASSGLDAYVRPFHRMYGVFD